MMNKKKILISILMVLFLLAGLPALITADQVDKEQEKKSDTSPAPSTDEKKDAEANTPFFKSLWQDEGRILSSPARMKGKSFLVWGGVAVVTGFLIANDEAIYRNFKKFQANHKWVDDVSPQVTKLGLGEWNLGIAGMFYAGGLIFKDARAKETARLALMTFIHTGVVVQIGKHLAGRQRPENALGIGSDHWSGPAGFFKRYKSYQLSRYDAFPSGHTISIFGTATVIAEMYKKTVWVPILSYSLASLCGLSRVTEDTHWLSDVFLGAVLGYAIGKYIVKHRNRTGNRALNIFPVANSQQIGIGLQYAF